MVWMRKQGSRSGRLCGLSERRKGVEEGDAVMVMMLMMRRMS